MNDSESWEYYRRLIVSQLADDKMDIENLHLEMIEVKAELKSWKAQANVIGFFWTVAVLGFEYWVRR